jgi:hypothetical protein
MNIYTKKITYEMYLPFYDTWVSSTLRTTDDAVNKHHQDLISHPDQYRNVVVSDYDPLKNR